MLPPLIVPLGKEVITALREGKALGHKVSEEKIQPFKQFKGWRSRSTLIQQHNLEITVTNRKAN